MQPPDESGEREGERGDGQRSRKDGRADTAEERGRLGLDLNAGDGGVWADGRLGGGIRGIGGKHRGGEQWAADRFTGGGGWGDSSR